MIKQVEKKLSDEIFEAPGCDETPCPHHSSRAETVENTTKLHSLSEREEPSPRHNDRAPTMRKVRSSRISNLDKVEGRPRTW